jgi:hypothetical protein
MVKMYTHVFLLLFSGIFCILTAKNKKDMPEPVANVLGQRELTTLSRCKQSGVSELQI